MLLSVILNSAIVAILLVCVIIGLVRVRPRRVFFRYFTTLSNLLCGLAAAAVLVAHCTGALPQWVVVFKYVGVCAVTVTMMTVLLFLGPLSHEWRLLLTGVDLFLHLVCPILAIESFLLAEKTAMPAWTPALGVLPVLLYAALYYHKVIVSKRWEDFYGFNRGGKWLFSFFGMLLLSSAIAFALWVE